MTRALWRAAALSLFGAMSALADPVLKDFDDLKGWTDDTPSAALSVFLTTCGDLDPTDWADVCVLAQDAQDARAFFETQFLPVIFGAGGAALFTGYFEPEIRASAERSPGYETPLYRTPPDLPQGTPWKTRKEISNGALTGQGLEIAWAADPVEAFFLQVQGSGRLKLTDGTVNRLGFAAKNGHPYRSIGQELIRRGLFEPHQVSAQVISDWVARNPVEGQALLDHNPSFVFFREVNEVPSDKGPLGAMNRSVTPGRSIAVDPLYTPLGAPVWIEKDGASPIRRLMVAQDTGSAIKGKQRADIFFGTGDDAGRQAGRIRDAGRMVTLLPTAMARRITGQN